MRRPTATRIPQPGRRRLGLEAENRKVNAQVGPRISWIRWPRALDLPPPAPGDVRV